MTRFLLAQRTALALAIGSGMSGTAWGQSLQTVWTIDADSGSLGERTVAREDYVFRQRLLPSGMAELAGPLAQVGLAARTQLVEVQGSDAAVFCDPMLRAQKMLGHAQPCLVDADRDGRFEGLFVTTSSTKGILTIAGKLPKKRTAIKPLPYVRVDVRSFRMPLFVGLQYRGNANPMGNHVFQTNFGSDRSTGALSDRMLIGKSQLATRRTYLGGEFEVLGSVPSGVKVRIIKPMASQSFSVMKVTTYRIY